MAYEKSEETIRDMVQQSPSPDLDAPLNTSWVKGKTIVITGGASGLGAAFLKAWAAAGASIIVGDVDVDNGSQLVIDVKLDTGNPNLHFVYCNVTDWQSQVAFFKEAIRLSPHGGIDTVVANAGIADNKNTFENPAGLGAAEPPPPDLQVLDVNITGVMYTVHLALFWLPRNPDSPNADPKCDPAHVTRDRHILLVSSVAGIMPIPTQILYGTSKHAVVGLFRCLRSTAFLHGIRINMLTPYWIDTPIIRPLGRLVLAGDSMGKVEDVVHAASLFVSDPRIAGRCLCVGPKLSVEQSAKGEWELVSKETKDTKQRALWEVYPSDFDHSDDFTKRVLRLLMLQRRVRGWYGWLSDTCAAVMYGLKSLLSG